MSVEIKSFIRPTLIVRGVMRTHGFGWIYTNAYEHCRTVKCYTRGSVVELIGDIRTALVKAGVRDFKITTRAKSTWRGGDVDSLIVRIPRAEQA